MARRIIKAAPDYLALNVLEFGRHFTNLLTSKEFKLSIEHEKHTRILGYSCRSLFEVCLQYFDNRDLVVATTPIQHTSFRNILEKYVKPENLHIIRLNTNFNEIQKIPDLKKCDIVVITHYFGQDIDLTPFVEFKKKHNCFIIEDRVQGATMDLLASHEIVDIPIYSMGMDKRPIALGGGFMYIDNQHEDLIKGTMKLIAELPIEKTGKRFKDMLKKLPTYLFYNSRIFLAIFIELLRVVTFFNKKFSLLEFAKAYRAKNPGFDRTTYMSKPSKGLLKSMYQHIDDYKDMEELFARKYSYFIECLDPETIAYFIPWYKGESSLAVYNTLQIEEHLVDQFLEFLTEYDISCITNPTYKVFNHEYEGKEIDVKFNNGIVYIPSTPNMKKREIRFLADRLKEFYDLIHQETG
ncbi:MAG: hypothetical protein HeimAB125_12910 [Candidatus Heimdallarchaeota archaeon AB_125]|nr:MAG: hypothetical protein HeimAB125_12910 [Candidatus Heimdallarchaeota archaeon AB_125]